MEQKVLYQLLKMFVVWAATLVTAIMQFLDQFRSRLISQLIKGTWRVLQKLLRHFNGTIISTFSVPLFPAWSFFFYCFKWVSISIIFIKIINITIISKAGLFLQYCHKTPYVFEKLSLYSIKLYIEITTSISWASSNCILLTLLTS